MVCNRCGMQVANGERFCPRCGAEIIPVQRPQAKRAVKSARPKTVSVGNIRMSIAQLFACIASIVGLFAFIFYFLPPRTVTGYGNISFGALFDQGYTGFFHVLGAFFTFFAVAFIAVPVILQLICKNDEGEFEIPLFSFILYLISFIINLVTAGTIGRLSSASTVTFFHLVYILFSIAFLIYCIFSAFMAFRSNGNRIKIMLLGYTLFDQK
ncbi:MAG: zinc-ribbon domain-containing protein [Clostridia bacterium]|nr:zinc-ribbon domain-containing protein [Clostridia bacterium]